MIISEVDVTVAARYGRDWSRSGPVVAAVVVDAVITSSCMLAAAALRLSLPWFKETRDIDNIVAAAGLPLVLGWLVVIALHGGYAGHIMGAGTAEYKRVIRASMVTAGVIGITCYLFRIQFSRGFFFLIFLIGLPMLLIGRQLMRVALHQLRIRGHLGQRVVVAGGPAQVDEVTGVLFREKWLGYHVIGALVPPEDMAGTTPRGLPILGSTARTAAIVRDTGADIVLFAGGAVSSAQQMRRAAWDLEDTDVQIMLTPSLTDVANDRVRLRPAAGLQLMELEGPRVHAAAHFSKRIFDMVGAAVILLLVSPIFALTSLAIWRFDRGPVFFRQQRVGRGGELFGVLKFRSMVVNADQLVVNLAEQNKHDEDHVLFKMENDPRVTPPGRVIRRYSIDELPQLVNVLRGEMSLVGPRPPLPSEVEQYTEDVRRRLAVRPGMTGLWQVSGRSDLSWEDSVRLDLYYVDNWSMVQDLAILLKTVRAVVSSRGAY